MKFSLLCWIFLLVGCQNQKTVTIRVLQFNIWQEGTQINGGFDAIIDEIIHAQADLICLSEVRNYNYSSFDKRIVEALKQKGYIYYAQRSEDTGLLSRFPILNQQAIFPVENDRGSITKALIDVKGITIALYSAHLDYRNCACYLPRGYHSSTWKKLPAPVTDIAVIKADNLASRRDEAIDAFIKDAQNEVKKGSIVFLGGDFNEPSHLDWTADTKELFDHNGVVIQWRNSVRLTEAGFVDVYRQIYPNPVSHPGFTFPADNQDIGINRLAWSPDADDRDRIDFVYFYPDCRLNLKKTAIIGPNGSIVRNNRVAETSQDLFIAPVGIWPTDHKAILAVFDLKLKKKYN
ncbi:MAG: endonuclease/exonuclease/phosphatase family protein [Phycisphaerae bacterium]|nr:endonuclease/exonuclease/phosphatase family protein [Phycisphaerae bacterium]